MYRTTFGRMGFANKLTQWYLKNKRELPWRDTTDAYVIWLSEIILQQTRVDQGLPYFYRFIEKYPDVKSFAAADENDILKLWQGLGYYSRGRNMLKTARQIVEQYDGKFPETYLELIRLKGIGEYTAAAISSFAANEPRAVVDGNVFRVLARYFGIEEPIDTAKGKKVFQGVANDLLNREYPGLHNQAMMEFGAVLCKPKRPDCPLCPLSTDCYALTNNMISVLPGKPGKVKIRERFFNYFLITDGNTILMNKRDEQDIWANMYDLPLLETSSYLSPHQVIKLSHENEYFRNIKIIKTFPVKKHLLTHQHLHIQFIHVNCQIVKMDKRWFYMELKDVKKLAFPKIIAIFINKIFNL